MDTGTPRRGGREDITPRRGQRSPRPFLHRALPEMIPLREAGAALGRCARTLKRRIDDGELPAFCIRGRWFVTPEDLRAYVERHRVAPRPPRRDCE